MDSGETQVAMQEFTELPDDLPGLPGAYALWIETGLVLPLPPRVLGELSPGIYCYCGSARGPGGIRARCRRYLQGPPHRHWHVDWLTDRATVLRAMAFPGLRECDLLSRLIGVAGCDVPVPGFGSSDCPRCPAHLIRVAPGLSQRDIARALKVGMQA